MRSRCVVRGWRDQVGVVAGDQAAGAQLQEVLRPSVYRRYLDFSAIEALRKGRNTLVVRYGTARQFISIELAP